MKKNTILIIGFVFLILLMLVHDKADNRSYEELVLNCEENNLECSFEYEINEEVEYNHLISEKENHFILSYGSEEEIVEEILTVSNYGDVIIYYTMYDYYKKADGTYNFDEMFTEIASQFDDVDLLIGNQETIAAGCTQSYPRFCSPYEITDSLINVLGTNVINVANNHTYDMEEEGIERALSYYETKEFEGVVGAYKKEDLVQEKMIVELDGFKIGVLSYTEHINGIYLPNENEHMVSIYDYDKAKSDVKELEDENVDFIITLMHWGDEYIFNENDKQREIAEELSGLGIDVILGSHPHVIQPIEYINDTLVAYSLGNFVAHQHSYKQETTIGGVIFFDIRVSKINGHILDSSVENVQFLPTYHYEANHGFKVVPLVDSPRSGEMSDIEKLMNTYMDIEVIQRRR